MTRHRPLAALLASTLALLAAPAAAQAGTYDVSSCDATAANVNRAWAFETNDTAHIEAGTACGTYQPYSGTYVRTKLGSAGTATGAYGQWILRAPAGTLITRVQLSRWLGMEGGTGWRPYGRTADGTILPGETCAVQLGADECNVGGAGTQSIDHTANTTSIAYGFDCISTNGCVTGATIHAVRAAVYSSRVTIDDPTAPTLSASTGPLLNESGYHRGTEAASVNGSDTTGLKALRVYIDGNERAGQDLACDYTNVVPCSNPNSAQTLSVNLAATSGGARLIPDGTHSVQVAAVDAAGNETRSIARSIVVDATAPAAPTALASSVGSSWQSSRDFTATWTQPSGQVAPIDTAHWSLCPAGTTTGCLTGSAPVSPSSGTLSGLRVPGEGVWDFSLRLQDAAGNTATSNVARTTIRYDATPPAASPNLALANRTDTDPAFLAWFNPPSGQLSPVTEAEWTLCPQASSSGCASGSLATDPSSTNYLRTTVPSHGDWTLTIRLRDQAGNLGAPATTSLRYASPPAPTPTPTPAPSVTPGPSPSPTPTPTPAPRASAKLRVTSAVLDRSRRTLAIKGTAASTATGAVRVKVVIAQRGRARTMIKTAALRSGRFAVRIRLSRTQSRGRIRVSAAYGGSAAHAPDRTAPRSVRVR